VKFNIFNILTFIVVGEKRKKGLNGEIIKKLK